MLAAAAAAALPLGVVGLLGQHASASAPEEIPGDRQSPVVAQLAGQALQLLGAPPASGWASTGQSTDARFRAVLADAAEATAIEVGANPREMQLAWLAADQDHQVALLTALTQLGAPYQSVSSSPEEGFDCSGLTSYAWGQAGLEIPRRSGDQIDAAAERDALTAMPGDLVEYPGHVMMSLGVPAAVVHSSNPESDVELWVLGEGRADNVRYGDPTEADS